MSIRVSLGRSGLMVSPIALGNWQASPLWGEQPDEPLLAAVAAAFDAGINLFDTAPNYGDGRAEILLGKALRELPRDEVVVATKAYCLLRPDGKRVFDLSGPSVLRQCDASLARLRVDYIDLYQMHVFDPAADPEETTAALEALKTAGKIRAYGASNYTADQLRMALTFGNYATLQPRYSLLDLEAEADLLPCALAARVGVLAYSPQAKGLLTGKYTGEESFTDSRKNAARFQGETFRTLCAKVRGLQPIADKYGLTIAQLVLAATLMHPAITCAIAGAKIPEQIRESAGAMGHRLEKEDYEDIREALG